MPTESKLKPDIHAAFVAEALRLRAQYAYREACNRAEQEGQNLPAEQRPSPPTLAATCRHLMT